MTDGATELASRGGESRSAQLNRDCLCITLDRDALCDAATREIDDPDFCERFIKTRPHLFSGSPMFVPGEDIALMHGVVQAIEAAAALPGYRDAVLAYAPEVAARDFGPRGVFMGYDFHLTDAGPRLIEVNTNAGGAFLNALLMKAQIACCAEVSDARRATRGSDFDAAVARMFEREWSLQGKAGVPGRIAIADDRPEDQYLYPEFILARRFLAKHGLEAVIADAGGFSYEQGRLSFEGATIDLVYNRMVDFPLDHPDHVALRAAYLDGAAVVTPNPRVHALFADKRNLVFLSDAAALAAWGLPPEMGEQLARAVPRTVVVTAENERELWSARKRLFFKPSRGYGSKAVYRGDKLTKGVWAEILRGGYVAQEFAAPSERMVKVDGVAEQRKADVRLYVYDGTVLLTAARLYQGQTTNFRTPGGGFAPVYAV